MHIPVLADEVVEVLNPKDGEFVVDLTVGAGGHALRFAEKIGSSGILVGIDIDEEMLAIAERNLMKLEDRRKPKILLVRANFSSLDEIMERLEVEEKIKGMPDVLFADLGISSYHIQWAHRGFSLNRKGPLDMRLSKDLRLTAEDVVMSFPKDRIERILRDYGEERFARQIAERIVEVRQKTKGMTTTDLAEIVEEVYRARGVFPKIHPATRTFMALRIFVNEELENLSALLEKVPNFSKGGTRFGIISFHSLEDRLVKRKFREWESKGLGFVLTRKPVVPSEEELVLNPRSRSAKFRAFLFSY